MDPVHEDILSFHYPVDLVVEESSNLVLGHLERN